MNNQKELKYFVQNELSAFRSIEARKKEIEVVNERSRREKLIQKMREIK